MGTTTSFGAHPAGVAVEVGLEEGEALTLGAVGDDGAIDATVVVGAGVVVAVHPLIRRTASSGSASTFVDPVTGGT
ncbi:hypothetical protein [Amnibacterium sp.]|uniref:hypothetical protein n=1 Tax=Amnibacterium sp. TaxID=1872496 RepID=UPI003F7B79CC